MVFNASNRFGAPLAGARFFFGFRPRLLGIGKQYAPRLNNTASADRRLAGYADGCTALRRGQIVHAPARVWRTIRAAR